VPNISTSSLRRVDVSLYGCFSTVEAIVTGGTTIRTNSHSTQDIPLQDSAPMRPVNFVTLATRTAFPDRL
jgi:hypothetical protein